MNLETKKDIWDTTPHAKFDWCGMTGRGSAWGGHFPLLFVFYSFFCILAHAYRSHQKTDHDRLWLKTQIYTF